MTEKRQKLYEVRAVPKGGGRRMTLRRFVSQDEAVDHALAVNMDVWDDVFVRPTLAKVKPPEVPPPMPWRVLWADSGHAYVVDADGKKIASLLGSQQRREYFASMLLDMVEKASDAGQRTAGREAHHKPDLTAGRPSWAR